jgi:hypothetical protein
MSSVLLAIGVGTVTVTCGSRSSNVDTEAGESDLVGEPVGQVDGTILSDFGFL